MMTVYRGDDTGGEFGKTLTFTISTDKDIENAKLCFEFCGVRRTFEGVKDGDSVEIFFSHNETARFPLGTSKAVVWLVDSSGKVRTLNNALPIRVTSNLAECYAGDDSDEIEIRRAVEWERITNAPNFVKTISGITADSAGNVKLSPIAVNGIDLSAVAEWDEGTTMKERRDSFNKLLAAIKAALTCFAAMVCGFALAGYSTTAKLGDLSESASVVTSFDEDSATKAITASLDAKEDAVRVKMNGTTNFFSHTGLDWIGCAINFTYTNGWVKSYEIVSQSRVGMWKQGVPYIVRAVTNACDKPMSESSYPMSWYSWDRYKYERLEFVDEYGDRGHCYADVDYIPNPAEGVTITKQRFLDTIPEDDGYGWKNYRGEEPMFMVGITCDRIGYKIYLPAHFVYSEPFAERVLEVAVSETGVRKIAGEMELNWFNWLDSNGYTISATNAAKAVSNIVSKAYVEGLGIKAGSDFSTTNPVFYASVKVSGTGGDSILTPDGSAVLTANSSTNALRAIAGTALNSIYDESLRVTWKAVMIDGNLYYTAVTNANTAVVK